MVWALFAAFVVGLLSTATALPSRKGDESRDRLAGSYRSRPLDHFSQADIEKGKSYQLTRLGVFLLKSGAVACGVIILLGVGGHGILEAFALRISGGRHVLAVAIATTAFFIQISVLAFPFNLYGGYVLERSYGLLTQGYADWFLDHLKGRAVELAILLPLSSVAFLLLKTFPSRWWLVAGCSSAVLVPVFVLLSPVVVDPLFNRFAPIENGAVRDVLLGMAERAGVETGELLEMDASSKTVRWNAYVTGIGNTKRIVVYDTLIRDATPEQIGAVFAHELGHWRRNHLWKGVALCSLGFLVAFFIVALILRATTAKRLFGISDPASFGGVAVIFLSLAVLDFASLPLQNWVSRRFETEADRDALALAGDSRGFLKVQERLAARNLADVTPNPLLVWLFYSHPPVMERIALAEAAQRTGDRAGVRPALTDAVKKPRGSRPSTAIESPGARLDQGAAPKPPKPIEGARVRSGRTDAPVRARDARPSKSVERSRVGQKTTSGPSIRSGLQPSARQSVNSSGDKSNRDGRNSRNSRNGKDGKNGRDGKDRKAEGKRPAPADAR